MLVYHSGNIKVQTTGEQPTTKRRIKRGLLGRKSIALLSRQCVQEYATSRNSLNFEYHAGNIKPCINHYMSDSQQ